MNWVLAIFGRLFRWWRRRVWKACPWCGVRLLQPPPPEAPTPSVIVCVCVKGHYAEEIHAIGGRFIYQDEGKVLPLLQDALGLPEHPARGVRPRHLRRVK
jgi:hypothetical protein